MQQDPDAGKPVSAPASGAEQDDFIIAVPYAVKGSPVFSGAYVKRLLDEIDALRTRVQQLEAALAAKG